MDDAALRVATEQLANMKNEMAQLKNAITDRQAQLNRLEGKAAELSGWIDMWHRLAGTEPPPTAAERIVKPQDTGRSKRPKNPDREFVVDKALEIIRERGEPVSRRDLFEALNDRGVVLHGKNPEMVLSTMLWRSQDRIVRLPPHGYWPKGEDCPAVGYYTVIGDLLGPSSSDPDEDAEEYDEE